MDGTVLAKVLIDYDFGGSSLSIRRIRAGKARLFSHYFRRGIRHVLIDAGESRLPAELWTAWKGARRQWFLELHIPDSPTAGQKQGDASSATRLTGRRIEAQR